MKSNKKKMVTAGLGLLIIRSAGIFSNVLIHFRYSLTGGSRGMEKRISNSNRKICSGSACDLILYTINVVLGLALRVIEKPVNRCFALLSAVFRIVRTIIQGSSMISRFLSFLSKSYTGSFSISEPGRWQLSALSSVPGQPSQFIDG
jgi:hypothetical protein